MASPGKVRRVRQAETREIGRREMTRTRTFALTACVFMRHTIVVDDARECTRLA